MMARDRQPGETSCTTQLWAVFRDQARTNPLRGALTVMSDAYDYFKAHAVAAVQKARALPFGRDKSKQRVVARVYHLLAKEAAYAPNLHHLDDFRAARHVERGLFRG
jgi:hypothetical protein